MAIQTTESTRIFNHKAKSRRQQEREITQHLRSFTDRDFAHLLLGYEKRQRAKGIPFSAMALLNRFSADSPEEETT